MKNEREREKYEEKGKRRHAIKRSETSTQIFFTSGIVSGGKMQYSKVTV